MKYKKNYKKILHLIFYRQQFNRNNMSEELVNHIGCKLFSLLKPEDREKLNKFYSNNTADFILEENEIKINKDLNPPDFTITQDIIDNFPSKNILKKILFCKPEPKQRGWAYNSIELYK